ncbi:MAG: pyruvate dehydrogenase (acetyl-transferring) E1 component subunit alpha [Deltaproteobacteria bacterium]|nr:pyruvate dehydrogenase (acetyl-transferring) E1 component subunit alpha [Deltaproteobacteria bacterium]
MPVPLADQLQLYRNMALIRRFEEGVAEAYAEGFIGGFTHLYIGQEAVATGAISAINHDDYVIGTYRDHAHALVREISPRALMAELYGRVTGVCKGKGGSMHFCDPERYFMGGYAIVGGNLPLAVGLALSVQMRNEDRVVMAFLGDGASNQGVFHESLNMAKLWELPVIFVVENNFYGIATDVRISSAFNEIHRKAQGYGMPGHVVNGMDVIAVREECEEVVKYVRHGSGPVLIEARCYRYQGHSMTDPGRYRSQAEADLWRKRDPIPRLAKQLVQQGLDASRLDAIQREVNEAVQDAMRFAESSPEPPDEALYEDVYVESYGA